jgi:GDP-mannose pyrophosphatase NudK
MVFWFCFLINHAAEVGSIAGFFFACSTVNKFNLMKRVIIKNKEVVFNERAILQQVRFTIQNGKESQEQVREVYHYGDAVGVLLYNMDKRTVLLTKQFRLPTYFNVNPSGDHLEVCAGIIENGESPEKSVKREILEETGYKIDEVEKVLEAYSSAGVLTELLHLYLAPYNGDQKEKPGGGKKEEGEDIELIELKFEKAYAMMRSGAIRDAKTIMLLQHFLYEKISWKNEQH